MSAGRLFHVVFVTLLLVYSLRADEFSSAFESANKHYEQGKFADAATAYEKLAQNHSTAAVLYFNLGNARFKAGQLGHAIAAYRQAQELTPRDPDVRANLQFVRNKASGGQVTSVSLAQHAFSTLTMDEWTWLAGSALWLWFVLLSLGLWRREWKLALTGWTTTAGVLCGAFLVCLVSALVSRAQNSEAVVVVNEVVVRYGPWEESKSFYTARDGAELRVVGRKEDWLQVLDSAQRPGWLRRAQVATFPSL